MAATKIRSRWTAGLLEFFRVDTADTVLAITEDGIIANVVGNIAGNQTGAILGSKVIEKADSHALTAAEKANFFISLKASESSKTITLGLAAGQVALVYNHGTETFTLKNVAGDAGTSFATTKLAVVVGSATANASTVIVLN